MKEERREFEGWRNGKKEVDEGRQLKEGRTEDRKNERKTGRTYGRTWKEGRKSKEGRKLKEGSW